MTTDAARTVLGRLAERWSALQPGEIPDDAATVARQCVLDWLGCALAGSREPLTGIVLDADAAGQADGLCTLVRLRRGAAAPLAALVNRAAGAPHRLRRPSQA